MGKCKGLVEESAIVNTRAQAALAMAANATTTSSPIKKIKKTTSYNSRRRNLSAPENFGTESDSTAAMEVVEVDDDKDIEVENYCSGSEVITGTTPTSSDIPPSCCSSNENDDLLSKSDVVKDRCITDPEVESGEASSRYNDYHTTKGEERKETREEAAKSNGEDNTPAAPNVPDEKPKVQIKVTPSDSEIKEFFAAAEKEAQKRFIEKYNFDIVNDVPLEGRYEWVRITPP